MMRLAQALPDIAPPVNYSLVPPWMIFVGSLIVLTIIGLAIWYGRRFFRKKHVTLSPHERALAALSETESEVEKTAPYQFSIRVSNILRRYVVEQFDLPMTRQTYRDGSILTRWARTTSRRNSFRSRGVISDRRGILRLPALARQMSTS